MKKILYLLALLLLTINTLAQVNMDSLWGVWNDKIYHDTIRIQALNDFALRMSTNDPDSSIILADLVLEHSLEVNWSKGKSMGSRTMASCYRNKGDYDMAIKYARESLEVSNLINYNKGIGLAFLQLGIISKNQNLYSQAIEYYLKSVEPFENIDYKRGLASAYNNIGSVYRVRGLLPKALEYFLKSLKIREELGILSAMTYAYIGIGNVYFDHEDFAKALEYYLKCMEIDVKMGSPSATTYGNIGVAYLNLGELPKAKESIEKSLEIYLDSDFRLGQSWAYSNLGAIFVEQEDYTKALEYYFKSLEIYEELGNEGEAAYTVITIGEVYFAIGDYSNSITWCQKGESSDAEIDFTAKLRASETLYKSYKALGNTNNALEQHEIFLSLSDSLQKEETEKQLLQMEFEKQVLKDSVKYEEEKLLAKIEYQQQISDEKIRKNLFMYSGIVILILAIGLYRRMSHIRKSRIIIQAEKEKSENLLLNILPSEVADELKEKGEAGAKDFEDVSVLFSDFKGFTSISELLTARELVAEINTCFIAFDSIITSYGMEKIKTIGDSYMAAGGLHTPRTSTTKDVIMAGLEMQIFMKERKAGLENRGKISFEMRVGIHTGPVVAGIVGVKKFQYDIWGDTVNIASRMESSGEVGTVNISETTYNLVKEQEDLLFEHRGKIEAKNKGMIEMYFVKKAS